MRYLLIERLVGSQRGWTASGPFSDPAEAERAAVAVLATPTCLTAQVVTIREMRAIVVRQDMDEADRWSVCKRQLDAIRQSIASDYPETAAKESPMPDAVLADYLADRDDPREQLVR